MTALRYRKQKQVSSISPAIIFPLIVMALLLAGGITLAYCRYIVCITGNFNVTVTKRAYYG